MVHPIIRLQLAQVLAIEWRLESKQAVEASQRLILACQRVGLDIVREEWKNQTTRGFDWDDVIRELEAIEATGRTPWNPVELK